MTKKAEKQVVKKTLEIITLSLAKNKPITGYSVIVFVRKNFDVWLSSGTVYSLIHNLEKKGFVEHNTQPRAKYYKLTPKGEMFLERMLIKINEINVCLRMSLL